MLLPSYSAAIRLDMNSFEKKVYRKIDLLTAEFGMQSHGGFDAEKIGNFAVHTVQVFTFDIL